MNKVKYDQNLMQLITIFESLSGAKVRDIVSNEQLIFIVEENEIGRAIGRNGVNVKKIEGVTKKKVKIVEYSPDVCVFVRNFIAPLEAEGISFEGGIVTVKGRDMQSRGLLIGRDRRNLELLKSVVGRHFKVEDVKVA